MTILCMQCGYFGLDKYHTEHTAYRVRIWREWHMSVAGFGDAVEASKFASAVFADPDVTRVSIGVETESSARTFVTGDRDEFLWLSPTMPGRGYRASWDGERWDIDQSTIAHGLKKGWAVA